jgi:hypothetical protein
MDSNGPKVGLDSVGKGGTVDVGNVEALVGDGCGVFVAVGTGVEVYVGV